MSRWLEEAWRHDGLAAAALTPLSWAFGAVTALRNAGYDRGLLARRALGLPAVSVGNLTVGGTGKTPVCAWIAQRFVARGLTPAILMRGYGDDEPLVHRRLTPRSIVIADADRVRGAARARREGAKVLVLDDAFQHRRVRRDIDVVLVAAEQGDARRLLPAGPLREGRSALGRAQLLLVTRKSASAEEAVRIAARWGDGRLPIAIAHFRPASLVRAGQRTEGAANPGAADARPLDALAGRRVLAVSGVGDPRAFEAQLRAAGADVVSAVFRDHHAFTEADAAALARRAEVVDMVICTLKDAVKLEGRWPAVAPPFWYLSQALAFERGEAVLTDLLDRLRPPESP